MPGIRYEAKRRHRKFAHSRKVRDYVADWLFDEAKQHFIKQHEEITADWDHKPDFAGHEFRGPRELKLVVVAEGENAEIWRWVTLGTKGPYSIPKEGPSLLVWREGYQPHTRADGSFGGPGEATGDLVFRYTQVQHPGIEARKFVERIAEENEDWFRTEAERAWDRAIRRL